MTTPACRDNSNLRSAAPTARGPKDLSKRARQIRAQIIVLVRRYYTKAFARERFCPGVSRIPTGARVFDACELVHLVEASLDFWLTHGGYAERFERELADYIGVAHATFVNSGSSANLLAVTALTSPKLGARRLVPGDEIITVAAAFPTTVNPIVQAGCVPVFMDVQVPSYNIDVSQLAIARSARTRAVMIAHALGNPFDLDAVTAFCKKHSLWLIEDCCDAMGATYRGRPVGSFGAMATASFYPSHHLTTGEGGCVFTNDSILQRIVRSMRDWGRDCWCPPGQDDSCRRRFAWRFDGLPDDYDHKYVYSHIGYNLKATDMQAAIGIAQLRKLRSFVGARRRNFAALYGAMRDLEGFLILPEAQLHSNPSWFGFPLTVRADAPFTRGEMVHELERAGIATRALFAGNLTKHPAYRHVRYRVLGNLTNTDVVMKQTFWLGVYPGLNAQTLGYVADTIHDFVATKAGAVHA